MTTKTIHVKESDIEQMPTIVPNHPIDKFNTRVKIEWIPVKNISVVWAESQRPLDERRSRHIAENFDPDMFGTLAVTLPNGAGIYHAVDGQHRAVAVKMIWGENEKVPCHVIDADDPKRAAQIFDMINSQRKNPKAIDIFRVRVTAGEPDNVAVNKIVKANGLAIGISHKKEQANRIGCVSALLSVYRAYGEKVLDLTLKTIMATWGNDVTAFEANIVRAFGKFLSVYHTKKLDYKRLRDHMNKRYSPGSFIGALRSRKEVNGENTENAGCALMIVAYNKGRGKKLSGQFDE